MGDTSRAAIAAKLKASIKAARPYSVLVEYDGCPDEKPGFSGTRDQCLAVIRRNWKAFHKGKQSLALRNNATGRMESFMLIG